METRNACVDHQQCRYSWTTFFSCNGGVRSAESTPVMLRRRLMEVSGALVTCKLHRNDRSGSCHNANDGKTDVKPLIFQYFAYRVL
uniref:Protein Wnt n=1 Tax=Romanomermis culicivorax TaxID=13658 RepID=A0A915K405_ROMCU